MEFDTAVQMKQELASLLVIDSVHRRSLRPRVALSHAPKFRSNEFQIALRASEE